MEFIFVQDSDIMYYERSVYTVLDLLGDVGGLNDALTIIAQVLLFILFHLTKAGPHNYIIKRLFKREEETETSGNFTQS